MAIAQKWDWEWRQTSCANLRCCDVDHRRIGRSNTSRTNSNAHKPAPHHPPLFNIQTLAEHWIRCQDVVDATKAHVRTRHADALIECQGFMDGVTARVQCTARLVKARLSAASDAAMKQCDGHGTAVCVQLGNVAALGASLGHMDKGDWERSTRLWVAVHWPKTASPSPVSTQNVEVAWANLDKSCDVVLTEQVCVISFSAHRARFLSNVLVKCGGRRRAW